MHVNVMILSAWYPWSQRDGEGCRSQVPKGGESMKKQYRVAFDPDYGVEIVEEPDYFGPVTRYDEFDVFHVMADSEEEAIEIAEFERSL